MNLPKSHPRYTSLKTRQFIEEGVRNGITSLNGLIAHGRGEAFDYLIGEKTNDFAVKAIEAATHLLLLAERPVISVNGNTAALVPQELRVLSELINAPLEINLFHKSHERLVKIKEHLHKNGAQNVLLPESDCIMPYFESDRKYVNSEGIQKADVVFVPLEDGDRTEGLIKNGKKVITVDLNPLSRTAQKATITIVDNIVRVMPALIAAIKDYKDKKSVPDNMLSQYDNATILKEATSFITHRLQS